MELYQAYTDYEGMMELTESMLPLPCRESLRTAQYSAIMASIMDMCKPFERITMMDAVKKYCRC